MNLYQKDKRSRAVAITILSTTLALMWLVSMVHFGHWTWKVWAYNGDMVFVVTALMVIHGIALFGLAVIATEARSAWYDYWRQMSNE